MEPKLVLAFLILAASCAFLAGCCIFLCTTLIGQYRVNTKLSEDMNAALSELASVDASVLNLADRVEKGQKVLADRKVSQARTNIDALTTPKESKPQ